MIPRLLSEDADGLRTLTLNRGDKLNALDTPAFVELDAALAAIEQDDAIGCVVLRGAGRAFCAGADLAAMDTAPINPRFKPGVIDRLAALKQPTIAAVHGPCLTGGLELALACDFIVAAADAYFADTHGKWGLVSAWGMVQRLSRRIGESAAKRMMMTADAVTAAEALDLGLIDVRAADDDLAAATGALAARILASSRHTNLHVKRIVRETDAMTLTEALAWERATYPGYAPDHAERVARFTKSRS